jgi:hypothetical protein
MNRSIYTRVLAWDLHPTSFGFALFEGTDELLDWGIKAARHGGKPVKVPLNLKLALMLDQYEPDVLVIKKPMTQTLKRIARVVTTLARARKIPMRPISSSSVRKAFPDDNHNKYQIATALAAHYPELSSRLGTKRKLWESEKYSMSIFDAAALGVAYFTGSSILGDTKDSTVWPVPR